MVTEIIQGKKLTTDEIKYLVLDYMDEVEEIAGEPNGNLQPMTLIIKMNDKFYRIKWKQGLTEHEDDVFNYQPTEVNFVKNKWVQQVKRAKAVQ